MKHSYICIDLKSFYASVECADKGLDPFTDNLVVADPERTDKTICLAVTPAMKALGVKNRCRVFEIPKNIDYIMVPPRMQRYLDVSAEIYSIYLRFISAEDMHVYSVDECFIDATYYLKFYHCSAKQLALMLMQAVFNETGICATAGIGTNLFLCKIALDITAKHSPDNIGILNEELFRKKIWFHRPITDIWGIGKGIAKRLAKYGAYDLASVAALDPKTIMKEFGENGEFLIDHAWGLESCTISDIHAYKPCGHSLSNGQVLPYDYSYDDAFIVMKEMIEESLLQLSDQNLATRGIYLSIGYSKQALEKYDIKSQGISRKFQYATSSRSYIMKRFKQLFQEIAYRNGYIRRIMTDLTDLCSDSQSQLNLFTNHNLQKEKNLQSTISKIRHRFGKSALMKGISLNENATGFERNKQIGGHRA